MGSETNAKTTSDGWLYFKPAIEGQGPKEYVPGSAWQYQGGAGPARWSRIFKELPPAWVPGLVYRFKLPRASTPVAATGRPSLPEGDGDRLAYPMFDGLMAYFPNALAEVSNVSLIGNEQHNPGQPMHWAREKSRDHGNKIMRHLVDAGKRDARGVRHSARLAWRALALLQEEIERDGEAPPSRASVFPGEEPPRREVVTRETWGGVDA